MPGKLHQVLLILGVMRILPKNKEVQKELHGPMELSASSKAQVLRFESFRAGWKLKSVCVRGRCGWNGGSDFIWAFMGSLPQLKTHRIGTYFWLVKPLLVKTQPSGQVCSPLKMSRQKFTDNLPASTKTSIGRAGFCAPKNMIRKRSYSRYGIRKGKWTG